MLDEIEERYPESYPHEVMDKILQEEAVEQEVTRQPTSPGTILRRELKVRGWTQKYLAELMGRRTATISLIVTGKKRITPQKAKEELGG